MKRSGVTAITVLVAMLAMVCATALGQGRGMRSPEERAEQLKEELALTDSQTVMVKKIYVDGQKEMQKKVDELRDDIIAYPSIGRKLLIELTAKQDSLVEKLLTKEQLAKYEALKKQRQGRMQQMRRGQGER